MTDLEKEMVKNLTDIVRISAEAGRESAIEECAKIADNFTCGICGMDGKAGAAIRALAVPSKHSA